MPSLALAAYLLASRLAGPFARPILARRQARGKEDAARLGERLGHAGQPRPAGQLIWVHCASVGEAAAALPLIEELSRSRPDVHVLMTTGTVTAAQRMATTLPDGAIHQYAPVDTASAVSRFLDHWRPDLAIWIESELWPRMIRDTHLRGIPMALVNARLSAKSHASWRRLPGMARDLLGSFDLVLTQDHETVERLTEFGCKSEFAGNLKAAIHAPSCDPERLAQTIGDLGGRDVWLAASTHAGEESVAFAAHRKLLTSNANALLIVAPRHPERRDELALLLEQQGLSFAWWSDHKTPGPQDQVWLADTLGQMGLLYRLAPITFVGGSLTDRGGHTPFEPVLSGSAVIHGPDTRNFAPSYDALSAAGGAVCVRDADQLTQALQTLFADEQARIDMTAAAARTHQELIPETGSIAARLLAMTRAVRQ